MTAVSTPAELTSKTQSSEVIIKCAGLVKVFRDFWMRPRVVAVGEREAANRFKGIDLDVRRGEVFGLLGPNGSGKSTTIKMILGLLRPTSGRLAIFGKLPTDVATKRQIGYLPEESYLYRFLSARETLDYYGRLFHLPRAHRRKRTDELLEMVGLEGVHRRPVGEFSKGMQRRIGLAQALINDPQLLILDEPTTGLDPIGSRQIRDLIIRLSQRGKTILLCSHLLSDVEDVCQRVAIMFGGRVLEYGEINSLLIQQNQTTLHMPHLDQSAIDEVERVLARRGQHIERVEQPRQKLEALFLDRIAQAHARGLATSGAGNAGQIAAFLNRETTETAQGNDLIDKLMAQPQAPAPVPPVDISVPTVPDASKQVVSDLVQPPKPAAAPQAARSQPQADPTVLGELLGKPPAKAEDAKAVTESGTAKPKSGEKPDQAFIDALLKVPPYSDENQAGKNETPK